MASAQKQAVHIVGGGLAGSEAAWQIAACRRAAWCCTKCGRCAPPRRTRPTGWPSWSAPIRSVPTTGRHNAVGLLHEEMRRLGSLVMRAADANQVPAGGALAVDRDGFSAAVTAGAGGASADRDPSREKSALPPAEWDSVIVATGPLTSPALADAIAHADRRRCAGLLRRHRADRAPRLHRHGRRLVPVTLRQGRSRRLGRRLHQLPDGPRAVRGVRRGAASPATRRRSRNGKRARPISTAACRSR